MTASHRIGLVVAVLLALVVASPAAALTLKREWRAAVGTNGANGHVQIDLWTSGTGLLKTQVTGMRKGASYRVIVRKGSCSHIGDKVVEFSRIVADSTGALTVSRTMGTTSAGRIWGARSSNLIIRFVSGTSIRCGRLVYRHATRIQIPHYNINLAVVRGPNGYPYCNVAMYLPVLAQPPEPGVTYIYAHARKGMFLPLLNASKVNDGAAMIGRLVYVWTSANVRHTYKITRVRRHVRSIQSALGVTAERLWLQTSEGPNSTYPKLIVVAERVRSDPSTYDAAHPRVHIVHCG